MKKICVSCNKEFNADKSIRKYCNQICYGTYKSKLLKGRRPMYMDGFKKGYTSWNDGKEMAMRKICYVCGNKYYYKPSQGTIYCSQQCFHSSRKNKRFEKIRMEVRQLKETKHWRREILENHNYKCSKCGLNKKLEVDHFPRSLDAMIREYNIQDKKDSLKIKEFFDVRNGRVLCKPCHSNMIGSKNSVYSIRNRKVCVSGGGGMIGSHLVDELIKRGNEVLVIDNLLSGSKKLINNSAKFVWHDVRDDSSRLSKILINHGTQFMFHLVSLPYIPDCFSDPTPFFDINARGTMNVLMACQEAGLKKTLVYSSAEIYGTKKYPIKEHDSLHPQSTYGAAKIAADQLSKIRYVESGIPVVINRQFNVYSWRARHPYIIPEIISQFAKGNVLHLGNIESWRDFLYIDDAVNMAIELLEKGIVGEVYNIGAENCIQIKDLVKLIAGVMGVDKYEIRVEEKRLRPWDIERLQADTTKLKNTIDYFPQYDLPTGLKIVVDRFKENGNRWDY